MEFEKALQDLIGQARVSGLIPLDEIIGVLERELKELEEMEADEDNED